MAEGFYKTLDNSDEGRDRRVLDLLRIEESLTKRLLEVMRKLIELRTLRIDFEDRITLLTAMPLDQLSEIENLMHTFDLSTTLATDAGISVVSSTYNVLFVARQGQRGDDWAAYVSKAIDPGEWDGTVPAPLGLVVDTIHNGIKLNQDMGRYLFPHFAEDVQMSWRR